MRTSNPALQESTFDVQAGAGEGKMTIQGTVFKTGILALIVFLTGAYMFTKFPPVHQEFSIQHISQVRLPAGSVPWLIGGTLGALVVAIATCFLPRLSWFLAPLYAVLEGLALGVISAAFEGIFPGVVIQAIGLTSMTLLALLFAYTTGVVRATENFKLGILAATGGICLVYLMTALLGLFGVGVPYIHDAGPIGIAFSVIVVIIAAFNLVLDFDFIEKGAAQGAPKYLEWYAAFGLLVTLVWLYLEVLKLLGKLRSKE